MTLRVRGVVYDTGVTPFPGWHSRPDFDPAAVERDMCAIAEELHCTAVRLVGAHLDRLETAARHAHRHGLEVWLSPLRHDATPEDYLSHLAQAARLAETLRADGGVVLVVGWELTMFVGGLVTGVDAAQRGRTFSSPWRLLRSTVRHGPFNRRLNTLLSAARRTAREHFAGPLTYAAGMWEQVDWTGFDFAGIDAYREASRPERLTAALRRAVATGIPVVATETGCCTYRGARERGSLGWTVVDRTTTPPRMPPGLERSEDEQAAEVADLLDVLESAGAQGAFVFSFANWTFRHTADPGTDLDMAAYGIVACLPDGSWRPKRAFAAVARHFAD